jgi:hypothetical protein
MSNTPIEIPADLKNVLELVYIGDSLHIRCRYRGKDGRECGALFFNLKDAIRHLVMHDNRYKRYLQ